MHRAIWCADILLLVTLGTVGQVCNLPLAEPAGYKPAPRKLIWDNSLAAKRRQHVAPSVSWGDRKQGKKSLEEATANPAGERNLLSPLRGLRFSFSISPTADAVGYMLPLLRS